MSVGFYTPKIGTWANILIFILITYFSGLKNVRFKLKSDKFKVKNVIFKVKNVIFKLENVIFKLKNVIFKLENVIFKLENVIFKLENVIFNLKQDIFKTEIGFKILLTLSIPSVLIRVPTLFGTKKPTVIKILSD